MKSERTMLKLRAGDRREKVLPRYWSAVALALYFGFCYGMAFSWYEAGYFARNDLFFNTDPHTNLASLAHGWVGGRNAASHPLLEFLSVPVRVLGEALSWLLPAIDKARLREYIALAYPPLFGCVSIALFHRLLLRLQLFGGGSPLVLLTYALSFSTLFFSILPETYSISSALIISLLYYHVHCVQRGSGRVGIWFGLGLALTGTTITNVAMFSFVYLAFAVDVQRRPLWRALTETSLLAACLVLVAVLLLLAAVHGTGVSLGKEGGADWISDYMSKTPYDLASRLAHLVGSLFNTFSAGFHVMDSRGVSFRRNGEHLFAVALVSSIVLAGAYLAWRHFAACWRSRLGALLVAILAFNVLLHLVFGAEMFLYSQHWAATMTLLLAPVLVHYHRWGWAFLAANAVFNGVFLFRLPHLLGAS